jgi:hypothetical protein
LRAEIGVEKGSDGNSGHVGASDAGYGSSRGGHCGGAWCERSATVKSAWAAEAKIE